ncbi:MAG: biotin--[Bacilli bacterium]|nr:biotin--[acetyl-CoA-carboxylase] ligase [Bacilli bacterium]
MKIIRFDTISSTNLYLKENYNDFDNLTCVTALHQTNGRGRLGRTWVDNNDLLFSILVKDNLNNPSDYSFLITSSIITVLKSLNPLVKWPNDIIINDRKIAGILLEAVTIEKIECIIIGVGINTNSKIFSDDLVFKANSISNIIGEEVDNNKLLDNILNQFEKDYNDYINDKSDYHKNILQNFYLMNKEITFKIQDKKFNSIVLGMNDNNELIVQIDDQIFYLNSGEVTLTNNYSVD